jgi:hypothetical protein
MEARLAEVVSRATLFVIGLFLILAAPQPSDAAGYRTKNFVVSAPTPQLAKEIGEAAEVYRRNLANEWLGKEMPQWSKPCPINAKVAPGMGAGGATSFIFDRGEVFGWKMSIQGSRERILDSVLPHEITHTIFASHFRQPLPRWADEGACTTVEHPAEIAKQERNLVEFLKTGRGIPFKQMFAMKEYPPDVMPLYAQGHSLATYLIESRGKPAFLEFLADGMGDDNWQRAVHEHYGFSDLLTMQHAWNDWVRQGRPRLAPDAPGTLLAAQGRNSQAAHSEQAIYRGQSPDRITPIPANAVSHSDERSAVTATTGNGSVYAEAAARAERERQEQEAARPKQAPDRSAASVYDASRQTGVHRR